MIIVNNTKRDGKFTGICYTDDCGYYAIVNGQVLDGGNVGISGTLDQAIDRYAAEMDANREDAADVPGVAESIPSFF